MVAEFSSWLERFGPVSQDHYDFWAWEPGRRAKAAYYRHGGAAAALVAPFALADALIPRVRRLARRRTRFPIADAHYAMGYFLWAEASGDGSAIEAGQRFLDALEQTRCLGYDDYCWGYPFDWETCFGTFRAGVPLITTIPYCYEAFVAGHKATSDERYLAIAESTARFCFEGFPATVVADGSAASAYTPHDRRRVVNASAYRALVLADAAVRFARRDWEQAAAENIGFVLGSQQRDGAWLYAMDGRDTFIDNFHTCFVLKNLFKVWRLTGGDRLRDAITRGYAYYRTHLLDAEDQPEPFAQTQRLTLFRRELYDYAEGINLALLLREVESEAPHILDSLVSGLLRDWVLPDGHFVTRQLRVGRNTVPYHRWAQSQTFRSLALYCTEIR